jgi:hypothetical protein
MNRRDKDDVLTISLNNSNIVFTRYLYLKDEVKLALLISILNKNNDAIFWAYELYYSGFKHELFHFIWTIYYDFFATLNPSFEAYLIKKHSEYLSKSFDPLHISSLIQNLIIRPFNTDVFMMRKTYELFEPDHEPVDSLYTQLVISDYRSIAQYILSNTTKGITHVEIYESIMQSFEATGLKLAKPRLIQEFLNALNACSNIVNPNVILLSKMLSLVSIKNKLIKKREFYMKVFPEEVVQYETIVTTPRLESYKILRHACICDIDEHDWMSLFRLERNKKDKKTQKPLSLREIYNDKWLYHASFSPIWFDRIKEYKGYVDYEKCLVNFTDMELEEEFYNNYGYEPDEQQLEVKIRAGIEAKDVTMKNKPKTWIDFYAQYKNTGFIMMEIDELEAMNEEPITYV